MARYFQLDVLSVETVNQILILLSVIYLISLVIIKNFEIDRIRKL